MRAPGDGFFGYTQRPIKDFSFYAGFAMSLVNNICVNLFEKARGQRR